MTISEIQAYIESIEKSKVLYEEGNFDKRNKVIDFIDFQIIGLIEGILQKATPPDKLILLQHRAEQVKQELEKIDINLFKKIQDKIRQGEYSGNEFEKLVEEYFDFNLMDKKHLEEVGYDNFDVFINGLNPIQSMPEQTKELEPEMVFYQKTPARIVFEIIKQCQVMKEDVFFDLGSGLGQVAILVNLLTGITTKGVEFEPAFYEYAKSCAKELKLSNVTFINDDARKADYSTGTLFFMFTPFKGKILQEALELLRKESLLRKIKIMAYGPCIEPIAAQSWLNCTSSNNVGIYQLGVFTSFLFPVLH